MPRWVRLLSCSLTGAILLMMGLTLAAWLREGDPDFWRQLFEFALTSDMLVLTGMAAAVSAAVVLVSRAFVHLYGMPPAGGALAGGVIAPATVISFLTAVHLQNWGGWPGAITHVLPDVPLFAMPFLATSLITNWLWDQLD